MYRDKIAYLLTDGDIIEIKPSWIFRFHQPNSGLVNSKQGNSADIKVCEIPLFWSSAYNQQYFEDVFTISNRMLGQGQFGTVYLAKEVEFSTQVACKIIDLKRSARQQTEENSVNGDGRQRQKRVLTSTVKRESRKEIEILAALSHV